MIEKEFATLMTECQGESQEAVLKQYIIILSGVCNSSHSSILVKLLESAVGSNVIPARYTLNNDFKIINIIFEIH